MDRESKPVRYEARERPGKVDMPFGIFAVYSDGGSALIGKASDMETAATHAKAANARWCNV